MRSFAAILGLLAASLFVAALLAYPAWLLVGLVDEQPIHRVMHRIAMLLVLVGLIWLVRRWKLADRHATGFGVPRRQFWRQLAIGLIAGVLVILPLIGTLHALGVRIAKPDFDLTIVAALRLVAVGLATGLIVALIEEVFFRGVLFTAIRRSSGTVAAIVLPSLLYASLHFLGGRLRLPSEQIEWSSGFAVLGKMFDLYGDPAAIADSFLALFIVGVLLALVRVRTNSIAACIGLHAAWVCVIFYVKQTTQLQTAEPASWLVGSYDGVLGWAALGWMVPMTILYLFLIRHTWSHSPLSAHRSEKPTST
jgi:membrane protease YdiL (CAAX protease family)